MMEQKNVIRRKRNYKVQGYLNQDQEIIIQAQYHTQEDEWKIIEIENIEELFHEIENKGCHFIDH